MADPSKTIHKLTAENAALKKRIEDLQAADTDRQLAEEALRHSEQMFRNLVENANEAIVVAQDGRIVYLNRQTTAIIGHPAEELLSRPFTDFIHPEDRHMVLDRHVKRVKGEDVPRQYDYRIVTKEGHLRWVDLSVVAINWSGRGATLCFLYDITERKRAEEALRESEQHYRELVTNANSVILRMDREGRITFFNQFAQQLFGYTAEEVIGRSVMGTIVPETDSTGFDLHSMILDIARRPDSYAHNENENMRRDGSRIWISWTNTPLFNSEGEVREILCIGNDITERKRMEETLRIESERLEHILSITRTGIDIVDGDFNLHFVDKNWQKVYGDPAGRKCYEYFNGLNEPCPGCGIPRALETREVVVTEEVLPRENNRVVEVHIIPFQNATGKWLVAEFNVEITARKQAENRLRDSESKYQFLAESMADVVFTLDINLVTTYVSPSIERMLGFTQEERMAQKVGQQLTPKSQELVFETLAVELDREKEKGSDPDRSQTLELEYYHKDGSIKYLETYIRGIRDNEGNLTGFYGSHHDITDRKRAEAALRESEAKFRAMVETFPLAIHQTVGVEQTTEYVNPTMVKLFGYTQPDIPSVAQWWPLAYPDETYRRQIAEEWTKRVKHAIATQSPIEPMEVVCTCKDGSKKNISWGYITLGDKNYSCGLDITERKRAEEEREKLQAQLTQAQKMESVGRLAGGVAHDFNNMLGVILGHTEMAMDKLDPSHPLYNDLQQIRKAAERSADLTRQLLAFARKQTIAPKVLDLNDTVEGMLKMLRRLIGEDIDLAWMPGKNLWPVKMDPSQIDQILANLCVNARDAIEGVGKITIETNDITFDEAYCAAHTDFIPGEYVLLAVSDDGCGMDRKTLTHLFEPFFTTKGVGEGTGLGLATVYGIVTQNNGFINVYSEPGHGTTFKIYLPRHMGKAEQIQTKGLASPAERGHETILLVEDEQAILEMTKMMLEHLGYRVLAASTPGEAVRLAEQHAGELHILMTDVVMPEMNGRDLARRLLSLYPDIKRLFMSGYTANVIAHHGVLEEGVHFIQKPFSMMNLADKLRETLDNA